MFNPYASENENNTIEMQKLSDLCNEFYKNNQINAELYNEYHVRRGLRNSDGSGVVAGLTLICNVHGYIMDDGIRIPEEGRLYYRGISVADIVKGARSDGHFAFEETAWLLLFGSLPDRKTLKSFRQLIADNRELPYNFAEDMIIKAPSRDIMNKMARSVLALYSYDENPDDTSMENMMMQSIKLIARLSNIMAKAYQVKRRYFDNESMSFYPNDTSLSIAEYILSAVRPNQEYTDKEAKLLDMCLVLHAEHGGGNNSTFATRVLSSSGTDTYSAIAAAIGSLKGPRHGGANIKTAKQLEEAKQKIKHWDNDDEVLDYLKKVINKQEGDGSGLIYGMGHAVYTLSDPRAKILKEGAKSLAEEKGMLDEFRLLEAIERMAPVAFSEVKGLDKPLCANVDMYSGLVYRILGIPMELYTPMFAVARVAGWCAHRIEEAYSGGRIIRPAYRSVRHKNGYIPLDRR